MVGVYFLFTIALIPFIALIPLAVISALLIIVGSLLAANNLKGIDFDDFTEYFPAISNGSDDGLDVQYCRRHRLGL